MALDNSLNNNSSESSTLAVPKLRDDGSNWSDYHPRLQNAMGAKGLWRHVEGTAVAPVPYIVNEGILMLADEKPQLQTTRLKPRSQKSLSSRSAST